MDRPKALALSVSLTGVIAAATAALALNLGLVGGTATTPPSPVAAVSGWTGAGSAPVVDDGSPLASVTGGESEDEDHDEDHDDEYEAERHGAQDDEHDGHQEDDDD